MAQSTQSQSTPSNPKNLVVNEPDMEQEEGNLRNTNSNPQPQPDQFASIATEQVQKLNSMLESLRPISLIGSIYKIIAKILSNRLVNVLGDIVNEVQSAFIVERQMLDGPFILNEILQWCTKKKKKTLIFKVDFEKAFDSINGDFLDRVETRRSFIPLPLYPRTREPSFIFSKDRKRGMFKGSGGRSSKAAQKSGSLVLSGLSTNLGLEWRFNDTGFTWQEIVKSEVLDFAKWKSKLIYWYFAFGRHLDGLHVTWAHLEKKRTRLRTNTKTLEDLCSQSLETASQSYMTASQLI
ncbi:RNA-directed DNA polymerase, eukaryota, reverse transcriptase zinc-binding domain protein [Tanacetum coccineum]